MKKSLPFLLALLSVYLAIPAGAASGPTPSPDPNVVRSTVALPDGGGPIWYVDVRGSDTNTCTQPFTDGGKNGPCRQPQAAINKIPRLLKHMPKVEIDAGTYVGILVNGFSEDYGTQQDAGGILIDGMLGNSTLATGTATGTATSGTAGSGVTFGTMTQTGQTWTTNDLIGRFVNVLTGTGAGQIFPITTNTADTVTVAGAWTAPASGSTYAIQDSLVDFTTNIPQPATPLAGSVANRATIQIFGNDLSHSRETIVLRYIRVSATAGAAVEVQGLSPVHIQNCQLRPAGTTAEGIRIGTLNSVAMPTRIVQSDISLTASSNSGINVGTGSLQLSSTLIRNSAAGSGAAVTMGGGAGNIPTLVQLANSELTGFLRGARLISGVGSSIATGFSGLRLTCGSASGIGIQVGSSTTTSLGMPANLIVNSADIATCGTGLQVVGPGAVDVVAMTGAAATTGFLGTLGAMIVYTKTGVTLTAPTEISLDPASIVPVPSTFAGVTTNSCVATAAAGYYSKACAR